jgi:hypothetical protein
MQDEVLTEVLLRIQVFWDVTFCQRVGGSRCSFEMSGATHPKTQRHIPEDPEFSVHNYTAAHC